MNIRILNREEVVRLSSHIDFRSALERMFLSLANKDSIQPEQISGIFPNNRGDFITYTGILGYDDVFGAKLSPYIVGPSGAAVTAWTVLMSMTTGAPLLLCDSTQLTVERTAITTIIAADCLARKDASILTIFGIGKVGLAHLRHAETLRQWKEIRLCSRSVATRSDLPTHTASGCPISLISDSDGAIDGADVVMLCTSSGTPVIKTNHIRPGVLVTSISTNVANAHEIEPAFLPRFNVFCDYRATTPYIAGEMRLAVAGGLWDPEQIAGDLPELLSGADVHNDKTRPTFFRSVGLGLEDIAAASALLSAAQAGS